MTDHQATADARELLADLAELIGDGEAIDQWLLDLLDNLGPQAGAVVVAVALREVFASCLSEVSPADLRPGQHQFHQPKELNASE